MACDTSDKVCETFKDIIVFIGKHHSVFGVTLTDNFQYSSQFVDTCRYQREKIPQITNKCKYNPEAILSL
jgi:hypothetical protein